MNGTKARGGSKDAGLFMHLTSRVPANIGKQGTPTVTTLEGSAFNYKGLGAQCAAFQVFKGCGYFE